MRMRTIREASEHIAAHDPKTALTQTALRRLVKTGEIPSVRIGTKYLVSLETVEDYLRGKKPDAAEPARIIRPVRMW